MKNTLFCLFIFCSVSTFAQNGITFKVEKLSKPEELLNLHSPNEIYESLILSDMDIEPYEIKEKNIKVPYHIIAKSESPDSLVSFGPNSFFNGMYQAYADHRPFVLSPDMIWLLISQGFARHINANQESMRNDLVEFLRQTILNCERRSKSWKTLLFHGRKSFRNLQNKYPNTQAII